MYYIYGRFLQKFGIQGTGGGVGWRRAGPGVVFLNDYLKSSGGALINLLTNLALEKSEETKDKAATDAPDVIDAIAGKFSGKSGGKVKGVLEALIIKDWDKDLPPRVQRGRGFRSRQNNAQN